MEIVYSTEHLNLLLILLGLAIAIHFLSLRRARKRTLNFSNYVLLRRVMGNRIFHKNYPVLMIRILIVILVILTVSNTRFILERDIAVSDYVLAVDTSPSMSRNFDEISKTSSDFLASLPEDTEVGMVTFSEDTEIQSRLTREYPPITRALINLTIGAPAGTSISKAILTSSDLLLESSRENRTIILITDGNIDDNLALDLNSSLETLVSRNVNVITLGINRTDTSAYNIPEKYKEQLKNTTVYTPRLDSKTLIHISNYTGGTYFELNSSSSLEWIFTEIIEKNNQKIEFDARSYMIVMLAALLFLDWALGATNFKTLP